MDNFITNTIEAISGWLMGSPPPPLPEREVRPGESDGLLERFKGLSEKMRLPKTPRLLVRDSAEPNASYRSAENAVRINRGSLELMTRKEQDSELAHELGHAKSGRDEFQADAWAAVVTGDADARISGLRKIEYAAEHDRAAMRDKIAAKIGPNTARLYARLPEPVQGVIQESAFHTKRLLRRLHLDKHPPAEERYRMLETIRAEMAPGQQER